MLLYDYINRFFTDIGPNLAANFEEEWRDTIPNYEQEKMGNVEVDIIMMEKIVKDISIHKSSSVSNISSKVLKDAFMSMLPQLVFMYNLSFGTESFPDAWKIANVIPLKKGGGTPLMLIIYDQYHCYHCQVNWLKGLYIHIFQIS